MSIIEYHNYKITSPVPLSYTKEYCLSSVRLIIRGQVSEIVNILFNRLSTFEIKTNKKSNCNKFTTKFYSRLNLETFNSNGFMR